jgi:hypothetical protein
MLWRTLLTTAAALALTSCDGDDSNRSSWAEKLGPIASNPMSAAAWECGPNYSGVSHCTGISSLVQEADGSMSYSLLPGVEADYITAPLGSLTGKSHITATFKIEAEEGARLVGSTENGRCPPGGNTIITLYFAHKDNAWQADGQRWWASAHSKIVSGSEEFTITAPLLRSNWSSLGDSTPDAKFEDAIRNAYRWGWTHGNCIGYGHGATAEGGKVKITVTNFKAE